MKRKIAAITTSRADYSHLYWPLRDLSIHPAIDLRILACGSHVSPEFGHTVEQIELDRLPIASRIECLLSSDTDIGMAKTIGIATLGLAEVLGEMRPDLVLLIGDRYELMAPACVALALRIPIAHIEGGEITEGAIDDTVRNAITKMSHIHFTATALARQRVIAMGEDEKRVHWCGAPSLDHLNRQRLRTRDELERTLGLDLAQRSILVAYHPVTIMRDTLQEVDSLFKALDALPDQMLFSYPNADAGSRALRERTKLFVAGRKNARMWVNLDPVTYWSLLKCMDLFVGNSSSGIMETPAFAVPTVNVGRRQKGRERARNIIDAEPATESILGKIQIAKSVSFRESLDDVQNPYGNGTASRKIVEVLTTAPISPEILLKHRRC